MIKVDCPNNKFKFEMESKLELFCSLLESLHDCEIRVIAGMGKIKSNHRPVGNILFFKFDTLYNQYGQWWFQDNLSRETGRLCFEGLFSDGKYEISVDPEDVQKIAVRSIPINPFPFTSQNNSEYGNVITRRGKNEVTVSGRAWVTRDILKNWIDATYSFDSQNGESQDEE